MQLAPDFDKSLIMAFEDFVSKDEELEIKKEAHDIEHALKTPNKILSDRGDDEVEWGDQPLIAGTLGPYDPELALEAMAAPPMGPDGRLKQEAPDEDRMHAAIRQIYKARRVKLADSPSGHSLGRTRASRRKTAESKRLKDQRLDSESTQ